MRQFFLFGSYFCSNMTAKHVIVTFGLKVGHAFDSFEEVQIKYLKIEQLCSFTNNQGSHVSWKTKK